MVTFKTVARKKRADGFLSVYIRVTHRRRALFIKTDKMVTERELTKSGEITDPFVLNFCTGRICEYQDRLNRVNIEHWTTDQVVEFLTKADDDLCFSDYAMKHIDRMIDRGQVRNAKNYKLALQHMERFFGTTKIMFSQLTTRNMQGWIKSLETTSRSKEMYPVCMRQVFRAAVEELNDYDNQIMRIKVNPWIKTKIPHADTPEKRAITAEECRAFFSCPLPESKMALPLPELGRDVAMLCLCLAGINTIDLYELKKADYYSGIIHYQRAKTRGCRTDGAYFEMRVPEVVKQLFEKYASDDDDEYLFNFHKRHTTSDSFGANVNVGIKKICESLSVPKQQQYCVYTFRHTWATTAQNDCGANIAEVGFAMNHSQRSVTRGYIKIDFTPAWVLNEKVLDFIFFSDKKSKQSSEESPAADSMFRISPKMMLRACAFFQGRLLANFEDIGYSNVDEVINRLATLLPETIPNRSIVQFKIVNLDNDKVAVYERQKGKGF